MKRLVGILLSLALIFTLSAAACADGGGEAPDFSDAQVGDVIRFGRCEQDNEPADGPEPIEWLVLAREEGRLLVISLYGLDCRPFHAEWKTVFWDVCALRAWLNNEFLGAAFTADERAMIPTVKAGASDNPDYTPTPSYQRPYYRSASWSRVFLLSIAEAGRYFPSDASRRCELTPYAKARGNYADGANAWWWLRSPGYYSDFAALVNPAGFVDTFGGSVGTAFSAVRPAMWIYCEGQTEKPAALADAQPGDLIVFGSYEQDNNPSNGREPIEWLVLAREEDRLLALSLYVLDHQPYNTEEASVTWEDCTLRAWLNGPFLRAAFTEEERQSIPTAAVPADENPDFGTEPGNTAADQVFLLSIPEAERYCDPETAMCIPTAFVEAQDFYSASDSGRCEWWLRSPGNYSSAAHVYCDGSVDTVGHKVTDDYHGGVRPAVWITLPS